MTKNKIEVQDEDFEKSLETKTQLGLSKFHASVKLRRKYWINVENFLMECQAMIGNGYFDIN